MIVLSGDIGGTNTRLQLATVEGNHINPIDCQRFKNSEHPSLEHIVQLFLDKNHTPTRKLDRACFAAAGPIVNNAVTLTNLPWRIETESLQRHLRLPTVDLLNDFQAIGYGITALAPTDLHPLQNGMPDLYAPKALMGAGTGLGVGIVYWQGSHWQVQSTEGGHVDFAPTDAEQVELLLYLRKKLHRVSVERVVSGPGLVQIYKFARDNPTLGQSENLDLKRELHKAADEAALIAQFAIEHRDPIALRALDIFIRAYGASAGNLALTTLAYGGVYIVGGIAPKLLPQIEAGNFMSSFLDKGRMSKLLANMPVNIVLDTLVGLKGAALFAARNIA